MAARNYPKDLLVFDPNMHSVSASDDHGKSWYHRGDISHWSRQKIRAYAKREGYKYFETDGSAAWWNRFD